MSKFIDTSFRNFGTEIFGTHYFKCANCRKEMYTVQLGVETSQI